ncbi:vacuolar cation/proton exchanger 3-like isoform X1 [Herrania umbratica]|uniref:Vacuolar cation/proton exchanger n=1 Tax=Herrania umbratica TaxID=108875 RepID=A0A6J0ZFJ0_9ROSI|nr:vacuolar cation/proton exchanger 3-like isoform X1 [Herrania umbratica]
MDDTETNHHINKSIDLGDNPPFVRIHSHAEILSLEERAVLQLEDEKLASADSITTKKHFFKETTHCSDIIDVKCNNNVWNSIRIVVFSTKLNILMIFGPAAIFVEKASGYHGLVFPLSLLGIIPLAERLGYATEQLACFTGPTVGGLLNATFGNATELIISIFALRNGMIRVVQQSLLGSILSNMLLVLGCAFFSGGLVIMKREQVFNKATAGVNSGLLLMSVMGLLFPAVLHSTRTELHFGKSELALSRFSSCVMLFAYAAYLYFQLKSQKKLYDIVKDNEGESETEISDDDEAPEISMWEAIVWLSILTVWIAVLSEYLVDAIEGASTTLKIPVAFISVILLPIVGNAAEHAGAIMFAMKDKLDISLGVAIGSSTQIAMFGIPFCVIIAWIMGQPLDLNFQLFETATLFLAVIVVAFMLQEGTSNYFKGLMLILCYLIVAASFFVHADIDAVTVDKPHKKGE